MNENLVLFEGQEEIKVKTDKGETLINLANSAKVLGLTKIDNARKTIRISWKGNRSVYDKISKILENLDISTCGTNAPQNYKEEIQYILEEIENGEDRNSIYMSRWLTSMLAMECHNSKSMEYKSWLAQLDESYSKGELSNNNQMIQLNNITNQINMVASTMTQIGQAFMGIQEYVQDSIQSKDKQIDDIKELVGLRSANVSRLTKNLKMKVENKYKKKVWQNTKEFKEEKERLFVKFNVVKWEDISVEQYYKVNNYIENSL